MLTRALFLAAQTIDPVTPELTVPRMTTPTRLRGLLVLVWYGVVKALYTT